MKAFGLHDIQRVLLATLVDDAPVSLPSIKAATFQLDALGLDGIATVPGNRPGDRSGGDEAGTEPT